MLQPFHKLFPDEARREVRSVQLEDDNKLGEIPAGEYYFVESYCTNPDCDCERVTIDVAERRLGVVASISYDLNPRVPSYPGRPNPCLDPSIRQGPYAEQALSLFKEVALNEEYDERLKRHYRMVKLTVGALRNEHEDRMLSQRREQDKQQRKQQKAARRRNRRR